MKPATNSDADFEIEVTPVDYGFVALDELTQTVSVVIDSSLVVSNDVVIDSFLVQPYTFTFAIRNTTSEARRFELRIPDTNFELVNVKYSGGHDVTLVQDGNDWVITGTIDAYQTVQGQQPNGFNGTLDPVHGDPILRNGKLTG